jgi:hypothetical protein
VDQQEDNPFSDGKPKKYCGAGTGQHQFLLLPREFHEGVQAKIINP